MPKIEVIEYIENEDGSATVNLDVDEASKMILLEIGFNKIIADYCNGVIENPTTQTNSSQITLDL